jgi:hypothetical protein
MVNLKSESFDNYNLGFKERLSFKMTRTLAL